MDDIVKCSYEECQSLHRELKELIMTKFAHGANSNATIPRMVGTDIGTSHLTVKLSGVPSLNLTEIVDTLKEWRDGTTISEEKMPGNKTSVYFISVPILKRRERRRYDDDGYAPVSHAPRYDADMGEVEKPSNTTAMAYLMGLFVCGTLIVYKAAVGQAPAFLVALLA